MLEKEHAVASHQSGRNSGVIHSGIYYRPGSLKAATVVAGRLAMERFCQEHGVPFERCGKVIVAVDPRELPRLAQLEERARANGVDAERIDVARLRDIEPHVRGIAVLRVPSTGVVDFAAVARTLAAMLRDARAELRLGTRVTGLHERADRVVIETDDGTIATRVVVNCAGTALRRGCPRRTGPAA